MSDGRVQVIHADCRDAIKALADCSVDSCVTDGPYALVSIVKRFGKPGSAPVKVGNINASNDLKAAYARASAGFMGKTWDTGETYFDPDFWREVYRVLKPGAHVVAFAGTRTYHRLACAIEDAGFEIRDQIQWLFGSGFPKSHRAAEGWGSALKPANEPICLARKPIDGTIKENFAKYGTGAINIDGCRVSTAEMLQGSTVRNDMRGGRYAAGHKPNPGDIPDFKQNSAGRWPANVIHDGSDEVVAAFSDTSGQAGAVTGGESSQKTNGIYGVFDGRRAAEPRNDPGSAARFFYSAKADADDRLGSKHPTVKPVDLMRYLVRLITRKGGLVLDPFAGTGSTGIAAIAEGCRAILIEREAEYVADIKLRLDHVSNRAGLTDQIKQRNKPKPKEPMPLFGTEPAE